MIRNVLLAVFVAVVIGISYWGYQEHQEKNAILIQAENNYQQAFHDLTYHLDELQDRIGTALAMNSPHSLESAMAKVWRSTSIAHTEVGQLPLTLLPFNETEEFLAKVGELSYRVFTRDLDKQPLTGQEYQTLEDLYGRAGEIQDELRRVQVLTMKNQLRWMDVELALASQGEPTDNTIIDGFKTVDKNVAEYDIHWGLEDTAGKGDKEKLLNKLKGEDISKEEAKQIAKKFFTVREDVKISVKENGKKSGYAAYSVTLKDENEDIVRHADVSKKGRHVIWALEDRDIGKAEIGINKAMQIADQFLGEHGMKNMEMTNSNQYDNIGVFTFTKHQDKVRIYPASLTIKVSLDQGNVVGYNAIEFITSKHDRKIPKPKLTAEKARKKVKDNVKVMMTHLALITNDLGKEVLCYEFLGTINNETYRIFINSQTGEEEKVKKLDGKSPAIYKSV